MIIVIPEIPPSNNKWLGKGSKGQNFKYQTEKKRWADMISYEAANAKPTAPYKKADVTLHYYFPNRIRHDPDNYSGKMILDGLVKAGVIEDDSFAIIDLHLIGDYDKDYPRTEITIEG